MTSRFKKELKIGRLYRLVTIDSCAKKAELIVPHNRRYEYQFNLDSVDKFRGELGLRRDIEVGDLKGLFCHPADRREHEICGLSDGKFSCRATGYVFGTGTSNSEHEERIKPP